MRCYFPGFIVPSSTNTNTLNMEMYVYTVNFHKRYIPSSYWSRFTPTTANQINIGLRAQVGLGTITML